MNRNFTRNMILLQTIKMGFRYSTYLAKCIRYETFNLFLRKFLRGIFFSLVPSDRIDLLEAKTTPRHDRAVFLTYESLPPSVIQHQYPFTFSFPHKLTLGYMYH